MKLAQMFDFGNDTLGLYPFDARCLAAKFSPLEHSSLLRLGQTTVEFLYGMSSRPSRQIKYGHVMLYFPERWLSARQKRGLMIALLDCHEDYPLQRVHIVTGEPVIISDFETDMVHAWE